LEKNPQLVIDDLIPTGRQISRSIHDKYVEIFERDVKPLIKVANENGYAITADFGQNGCNYFVITLHLIDNNW
jgi:hypothetical protein